ncbi:hypothetical protein K474DRAFT_1707572 [Panus rudis PR-1116 ss-1]|nr:hypothetical protein K474DRAFT_1707572 [Panus rudis PR-1116 ss-1]
MRKLSRPPLVSTIERLCLERFKFRLLVVGKPGCGKSTLVHSVFGIDLGPETKSQHVIYGKEVCPDNVRLRYTEYPLFAGRDHSRLHQFIKRRIDTQYPLSERLNAIWMCLTAEDNGEGLNEILDVCDGQVPVIIVFTKYDETVMQTIFTMSNDSLEDLGDFDAQFEHAKRRTTRNLEQKVVSLLGDRGYPIVCTSQNERYPYTIRELIHKTDEQIQSCTGIRQRIMFPLLAWGIAQRRSNAITLDLVIRIGQVRFWRTTARLKSLPTEEIISAIHAETIQAWNFPDPSGLLSGEYLKHQLSQLVREISEPLTSSDPDLRSSIRANWLSTVHNGTAIEVHRIMAYIVDINVILNDLSKRTVISIVTEDDVRTVINNFIDSGCRQEIHQAIYQFAVPTENAEGLVVFEELKRLVYQFCNTSRQDEEP